MPMVELKIDDRECLRVLDKIARKGRDASSLMARIEGDMSHAVEENFAQEGRPKWAPLRPSTIRARMKKGHWPGKVLQVRGILAKSVQGKHDSHSAIVGTNDKRAKLLHFGGTVNHSARERVLHFGGVHSARMGKDRFGPGRATRSFAKPGKASMGMKVKGKAYQTRIPGRPFMTLAQSDIDRIKRHGMEFLQEL